MCYNRGYVGTGRSRNETYTTLKRRTFTKYNVVVWLTHTMAWFNSPKHVP